MIKGLYTAYTGMVNEQKRLDVLTNNLANADCVRAAKEVLNGHRNVPYHFFHMYTGRPNNYSSYVIIGNHILYDY